MTFTPGQRPVCWAGDIVLTFGWEWLGWFLVLTQVIAAVPGAATKCPQNGQGAMSC